MTVERFARTCWRCDGVDVVEECRQALAGSQLLIGRDECVVLAKCIKRGGKGVPLLAPLALVDGAPPALGVPPIIA